jgi:hypothetical protein
MDAFIKYTIPETYLRLNHNLDDDTYEEEEDEIFEQEEAEQDEV